MTVIDTSPMVATLSGERWGSRGASTAARQADATCRAYRSRPAISDANSAR